MILVNVIRILGLHLNLTVIRITFMGTKCISLREYNFYLSFLLFCIPCQRNILEEEGRAFDGWSVRLLKRMIRGRKHLVTSRVRDIIVN